MKDWWEGDEERPKLEVGVVEKPDDQVGADAPSDSLSDWVSDWVTDRVPDWLEDWMPDSMEEMMAPGAAVLLPCECYETAMPCSSINCDVPDIPANASGTCWKCDGPVLDWNGNPAVDEDGYPILCRIGRDQCR